MPVSTLERVDPSLIDIQGLNRKRIFDRLLDTNPELVSRAWIDAEFERIVTLEDEDAMNLAPPAQNYGANAGEPLTKVCEPGEITSWLSAPPVNNSDVTNDIGHSEDLLRCRKGLATPLRNLIIGDELTERLKALDELAQPQPGDKTSLWGMIRDGLRIARLKRNGLHFTD